MRALAIGARRVVGALILPTVLGALATPAGAEPREVFGYAGELGEWELTANVTGNEQTKEFSGPLTMTHVGICTVDDPEQKKGEIRLWISESAARVRATLLVDGVECRYSGKLSDFYTGMMICPDRQAVTLKLWLK